MNNEISALISTKYIVLVPSSSAYIQGDGSFLRDFP